MEKGKPNPYSKRKIKQTDTTTQFTSSSPCWREFVLEFGLEFGQSFPRSFGCPVSSFHSPLLKITRQPPKKSVSLLIVGIP